MSQNRKTGYLKATAKKSSCQHSSPEITKVGRKAKVNTKSVIPSRFQTPFYEQIYKDKFAVREISYGRAIDFDSFTNNGASFVYKWFNHQGWDWLLSKGFPAYPNLVKEFYTHMNTKQLHEGVVKSWIRGKELVLTADELSEVLNIPATGIFDYPCNKLSKHEDFDLDECMQLLYKKSVVSRKEKPKVSEFEPDVRLLHLMLAKTFIPRRGNKGSVSNLDIFVMYCVLSSKKMNMPMFMLYYMACASNQTKLALPYGMWLTLIFEKNKVDLTDELHVETYKSGCMIPKFVFNINTLFTNLRCKLNDGGLWVKCEDASKVVEEHMVDFSHADEECDGLNSKRMKNASDVASSYKVIEASLQSSLLVKHMLIDVFPETFTSKRMMELSNKVDNEMGVILGAANEEVESHSEDEDRVYNPMRSYI